jgi:hypothetical protein
MPEGKHQVAAAVARSQQEIASMRPKVARAVDIGREAVEHDVLPRVSAQTRRGKLKAMSLITRSAAAARTRLARRRLKQESGK